MGKLTEALAHLRSTIDRAIELADPERAAREASDTFKAVVAETLDDLAERVAKLEETKPAQTVVAETPPAPPALSPAPAPEAAPAAAPAVNAAPTGEEIAAAALAAAGGQAT